MFLKSNDEERMFMERALALAQKAFHDNEVPIGAIVVDEKGNVIGQGYNQIEKKQCQDAHAEMEAIRQAAAHKKTWRLDDCVLYVTIEPCTMCYGVLRLSRIHKLVFGAVSPVFGYHLDKDSFLSVYNNDTLLVKGGVLKEACAEIVKLFFQEKRVL